MLSLIFSEDCLSITPNSQICATEPNDNHHKSITFKWKLSFNDSYKWTQEGELYNSQTMRKINKTVNGYSIGYWISGKFYAIKKLRIS